jgi:asparagine synthase (glutamine-hydrolysing)
VALAVRRLKIIDLVGGDQPFYDAATGVSLVANGEIYNHEELRRILAAQGVEMRSRSDCETLLWLYLLRGLDFLNDVRGMFAFAIWDPRHQRLVLGRDRMGEKPLYIARNKHGFIFASELKALLASRLVDFRIEPTALYQYFHFNYVPEPLTMVSGVFKLPAAHMLVLEAETMNERLVNYWRMEDAPALVADRPAEIIRAKLEEVALLVTRSDVPIGISLSGGLDSSLLAALVAKHSPQTAHAFSIGYPGEPWNDERRFARKTAARLGLVFHEAELGDDDVVEHFLETIERLDEPIADLSTSCYRCIAQLARRHGVPVLIQGQGGDELFWGYSWVRRSLAEARDKRAYLDGGIAPSLWRYMGGPRDFSPKQLAIWAQDGFGVLPALAARRRVITGPACRIPFLDGEHEFARANHFLERAMTAEARSSVRSDVHQVFTTDNAAWQPEIEVMRLICGTYLLVNGLAQGDRISMAESVELRSPLVDHVLVETVVGLRKAQNDGGLAPKQWLKDAVSDLVPPELRNRPKLGFQPPIKNWTRALLRRYSDLLEDGVLVGQGFLARKAVKQLQTVRPLERRGHLLPFGALVFESWCRAMGAYATKQAVPAIDRSSARVAGLEIAPNIDPATARPAAELKK